MAIIHFINNKNSQTRKGMKSVLEYIMQENKTVDKDGIKHVTAYNCLYETAYKDFCNTKRIYGKEDGRQYYHFIQSFSPEDKVTPELAHDVALAFLSECFDLYEYELVCATHCDRDHIHNHFVFNSVSAYSGEKYHISQADLEELMHQSDEACRYYGLSVISRDKDSRKAKPMSDREYRSAEKNQSWKMRLEATIANSMRIAKSKEHFIMLMEFEGYEVNWTDSRKHITYTTPEGYKCRDIKLFDDKFLKEMMERELKLREEIASGITHTSAEGVENSGNLRTVCSSNRTELEGTDSRASGSDSGSGTHRTKTYKSDNPTGACSEHTVLPTNVDRSGREYGAFDIRVRFSSAETIGSAEQISSENSDGYEETGWEYERTVFESTLRREAETTPTCPETDDDFYDPNSFSRRMCADTAYLMGFLNEMFGDDNPEDDCQQTYVVERKDKHKNRGPSMGGM